MLPEGVPEDVGWRFLNERRDWLARAWARLQQRVPQAFDQRLPGQIAIPFAGETWSVEYPEGQRGLEVSENRIRVPKDPDRAREQLREWLKARARQWLPPRVAEKAAQTGLAYERVQVRDQRTRWGSCSSRGTISLNFRLLFHRPAVVDYLILHELCHTRHMNHGPRFHALVARHEPDWRALDQELTRTGGGVPGWLGW